MQNNINYSPIINVMLKAARNASKCLVRDFGEISYLQHSPKGFEGFLKKTKEKVEWSLLNELNTAKPSYEIITNSVLSSSKFVPGTSDYRFVVYPLDGELNFSRSIPSFAIIIVVEKRSGSEYEPESMVVESPMLGETYLACKGSGAWLERTSNLLQSGGSRLRLSSTNRCEGAVVSFVGLENYSIMNRFAGVGFSCVVDSCIGLAQGYLSSGKYDAIVCSKIQKEKYFPYLMMTESGAEVTYIDEVGYIISSSAMMKNIKKLFLVDN